MGVFRPLALTLALGITAVAQPPEDQVRRIFSNSCLGCHGSSRMSGLSVATREFMLEGGKHGPAIVPGKASASLLYKAVAHEGEIRMPPGKLLSPRTNLRSIGNGSTPALPLSVDVQHE